MPYTMENPPESMKGLPKDLVRQWIAVFNRLVDEHGEDSARKQAWGAIKKSWEQDAEGNWRRKSDAGDRKSEFGEVLDDIEIMRAGTHTSSSGNMVTFTDEDLAEMAAKYDPAYHESPVVVGHPAENGPAFGWVKSLRAAGGRLLATLELVPEFVETVRRGLFKKRSASIYHDLDGKGPYLRHVGFLGAVPPAVKALADISLNDGNDSMTIEFSGRKDEPMEWKERVKKWFGKAIDEIPDPGVEHPESNAERFSEDEVKAREQAAAEAAAKKAKEEAATEFAEKQKRSEYEAALSAHKAEIKSRLEALVKEGRVTPAQIKGGLAEFTESLWWRPESDGGTLINFSEEKKGTPYEWFMTQLESAKPQVHFGEFAGSDKDIPTGGKAGERLVAIARQKMLAVPELSFSEAFHAAQREHRDLAELALQEDRQK